MNLLADLPDELLGEIIHKLKPKYYTRMAETCRQLNNRIWSHYRHLSVSQTTFEKYFKAKNFDVRRFINLESFNIPDITILLVESQVIQLSRLTYLHLDYDQNKDQAAVVRQLTHLQHLSIAASPLLVTTNLHDLISEAHSRLTSLELSSEEFPPDLKLPITSRLRALSFRSESIVDRAVIDSLFDMTNLRELDLGGAIRFGLEATLLNGFSRLIHLQYLNLSAVTSELDTGCINFEEFQLMKALTRLVLTAQSLVQEDFINIAKLTSIEWLEVNEYERPAYSAYFSSLTNLRQLQLFGNAANQEDPLQYKYLTKLEYLMTAIAEDVAQLQYLPRLTHLFLRVDLTADETNNLSLLTQLHELNISCLLDSEDFDLSPLVNLTAISVYWPFTGSKSPAYQQSILNIFAKVTNLRQLRLSSSLHKDVFQTLAQFTQLTKLELDCKRSTFAHKHWNMAELPFKVQFYKESQ